MEIYYSNNELYIEVNDRLNLSLIERLERKLTIILDSYGIDKINTKILNDNEYNKNLLNNLIDELNQKYQSIFIVK